MKLGSFLRSHEGIAPLATFRILFGLLMFAAMVRFGLRDWVDTLFVEPVFHFKYWGFAWVPAPKAGAWILYFGALLGALGIMLGAFYRLSAFTFWFCFTWLELVDVSNYLNHYYFISLVAGLMIFVPAHRSLSVDLCLRPKIRVVSVPKFWRALLLLQIAVLYFYAGVAKIHPDWLLEAMPLKIWLESKSHLPLVGSLVTQDWVAYVFSWFGMLFDLTIAFFLLAPKTRPWAYGVVWIFHTATAIFFPGIGMFPWVMVSLTPIFFAPQVHHKVQSWLMGWTGQVSPGFAESPAHTPSDSPAPQGPLSGRAQLATLVFVVYAIYHLLMPLRYALYPGDLFWTEQGYRFSWRVMLMEKAGYTTFYVTDPTSGRTAEVNNYQYLNPYQEKMMSTQPDLILAFAHHLDQVYKEQGISDPIVKVRSFVSLNGSPQALFVDSTVDLSREPRDLRTKTWILARPKLE
jgi:hypothetical protein